jgi:hypothetical protein
LFSHPRVFERPNLWEREIKGYDEFFKIKLQTLRMTHCYLKFLNCLFLLFLFKKM